MILASTNYQEEEWNHQIQELNPDITNANELLLGNILCAVDDPHGILKVILCPQVLHAFNTVSYTHLTLPTNREV